MSTLEHSCSHIHWKPEHEIKVSSERDVMELCFSSLKRPFNNDSFIAFIWMSPDGLQPSAYLEEAVVPLSVWKSFIHMSRHEPCSCCPECGPLGGPCVLTWGGWGSVIKLVWQYGNLCIPSGHIRRKGEGARGVDWWDVWPVHPSRRSGWSEKRFACFQWLTESKRPWCRRLDCQPSSANTEYCDYT